jgi:RNA polymerase sigma-70 factor (ECF subfamily)
MLAIPMSVGWSAAWSLTIAAFERRLERSVDERVRQALAGAVAGDGDDLAQLYDLTARDLFGLALWKGADRGLAEDAVQEVFCRIAAGTARPPLALRDAKAWLLTCVRNAVLDLGRRERRPHDSGVPEAGLFDLAIDDTEHRDRVLELSWAVRALPPKLREAVYLHAYVGLSFREVGGVVGVPTFTAASRYRLAIRRLEALLGGQP